MSMSARLFSALLAGLAFSGLMAIASVAHADKKDGRITFEVSTQPADLAPGQSGTLVIKGILFEGLHIYAGDDEQAMTWKPVPAEGVAYDVAKASISEHHEYKGEFDDEARPVWEKSFTLRVPITLAASVPPGTRAGVAFHYWGCTHVGCYPPIPDHVASILLRAPVPAGPVVSKPVTYDEGGASARVEEESETKGKIVVVFTPNFGWHFYGPDVHDGSSQVDVTPVKQAGVTFGKVERPEAEEITGRYEVGVPYTRKKDAGKIELTVTWAGCTEGVNGTCNPPRIETLTCVWPVAGVVPTLPPGAKDTPTPPEAGKILFPVIEDDDLGEGEDEMSFIQRTMSEAPLLAFGLIFIFGLGLAFTPCVLPIIPITVSVITGGNSDVPRKRLAALLGTYVLGLCMAFATMGVIAAQTGGAMSALFAMRGVQWGIAILFLVLGFGMYGVFELQPPAWLTKFQGGAQKRSGSMLGAFLFGCLGAIIASPCTGPAIAALLIIAANEGSVLLGFSMFFVLGLGMGTVLFAAGSLNFMMRPGPWMVWVRYAFGILIIAAAMYYMRNYQLIGETTMWIVGGLVCVLAAAGIAWHLTKKEGEAVGIARVRGLKVGILTALAIVFVAWYTRVPDNLLHWTYLKNPAHLQALVAESQAQGKPVVVDFWGDWCTNCKVYDKRIASTPSLRERFERITRLKVDLSDEKVRWPMRHALGVEASGAPVMVFIDRQGQIRRKADIVGLQKADVLALHIDLVLKKTKLAE